MIYTLRKRYQRKKKKFLPDQKTFAVLDAGNLKANTISDMRITFKDGKIYSVPLFLVPPKITKGNPIIMVIFSDLEKFYKNLSDLISQPSCLGVCIESKWYSPNLVGKDKMEHLREDILAFMLKKNESNTVLRISRNVEK